MPGRARAEGEEVTVKHGIDLASSASYFICAVLWAMSAFAHKARLSGAFFEVKDSAGHTRQSRKAAWLNFWAAIFTGLGALMAVVASLFIRLAGSTWSHAL
jgi:hypothetical protein